MGEREPRITMPIDRYLSIVNEDGEEIAVYCGYCGRCSSTIHAEGLPPTEENCIRCGRSLIE